MCDRMSDGMSSATSWVVLWPLMAEAYISMVSCRGLLVPNTSRQYKIQGQGCCNFEHFSRTRVFSVRHLHDSLHNFFCKIYRIYTGSILPYNAVRKPSYNWPAFENSRVIMLMLQSVQMSRFPGHWLHKWLLHLHLIRKHFKEFVSHLHTVWCQNESTLDRTVSTRADMAETVTDLLVQLLQKSKKCICKL